MKPSENEYTIDCLGHDVREYQNHITELKSKLAAKDAEILALKEENARLNELLRLEFRPE